ncbi:PASTA domain-containing protein, partial [Candidatus Pacearchaeota archaeon]|nr:PASTA domain-containing protein [Candidatus Pacearchaeota archaeon]
ALAAELANVVGEVLPDLLVSYEDRNAAANMVAQSMIIMDDSSMSIIEPIFTIIIGGVADLNSVEFLTVGALSLYGDADEDGLLNLSEITTFRNGDCPNFIDSVLYIHGDCASEGEGEGDPPSFTYIPGNQEVQVGDNPVFDFGVNGDFPMTQQWLKDGTPFTSTFATPIDLPEREWGLELGPVGLLDTGTYRLILVNDFGSASLEVTLSVTDPSSEGLVKIPDFRQQHWSSVWLAIGLSVFEIEGSHYETNDEVSAGCVISQVPVGGTYALPGTKIYLVISSGPAEEAK